MFDVAELLWAKAIPVAFVASTDLQRSRAFYEGVLGLRVQRTTSFALVLVGGGTTVRVTRVDLLMDAGRMINPGIDRGQITGGFIQGMGWCTTEELKWSPRGELWSHSPTTYKIPNISDVPAVFNVDWIENAGNTQNIRGSKAVGEPPLLLAISVFCAIKNALSFVSGGEIPQLHAPATGEEILKRLTELRRKTAMTPAVSA